MRANSEELETGTAYKFRDPEILHRALTHSSLVHEKPLSDDGAGLRDNEQLEFLGDAVLGFLVSEFLFRRFPEAPEGQLSPAKAHIIRAEFLADVALVLGVGEHLKLARGEEMMGGRNNKRLLANAVEAIIAALYLDGGIEAALPFVAQHIIGHTDTELLMAGGHSPHGLLDFKTALQELTMKRKLPLPRYLIIAERGPQHSKTFIVEARIGDSVKGQGEDSTKKRAAQKAAREAYEQLTRETL